MTRKDWQRMTKEHADAARRLLQSNDFSSAYHLSGLALECAFKAKISRGFKAGMWPEKGFVTQIYSHNPAKLLELSGLRVECATEEMTSAAFRANWNTAKGWDVESRYKRWSAAEARDMVAAITQQRGGVLGWVKRYW